MEYRVTWVIDLDAESFEDAARVAREIQLDPDSLATHFTIRDRHGDDREVWSTQNTRSAQEQGPTEHKGEPSHDH